MARPETAQIEEPAEKVVPIAESEAEPVSSPGSVTKRPLCSIKRAAQAAETCL
jgi:hypothetical protein